MTKSVRTERGLSGSYVKNNEFANAVLCSNNTYFLPFFTVIANIAIRAH